MNRIRKEDEAKEAATGCIGGLILLACIAAFVWWVFGSIFVGPDENVEEQAAKELTQKAQTDATLDRMAKAADEPCRDHGLYFFRVLGAWYSTCGTGCAGIPASDMYPRSILRILEDHSVRGRMTMLELRQLVGQC